MADEIDHSAREEVRSLGAALRSATPRLGLSGKLLGLTLVFVMMAEVLIYVPSVANFRLNWLNDRLSAAYTAALVFEAAGDREVPESVAKEILASIGARGRAQDGSAPASAGRLRHAAGDRP